MQAGLLVRSTEEDRLCVLLRIEDGRRIELEAFGDLVFELDLGAERVGGGPGLGEGETVDFVRVFGL